MISLPIDNIRSMDRVDVAGGDRTARITRTVTAGWENRKNPKIAVHTAIAVRDQDQLFLAEMTEDGLVVSPFYKYQFEGTRRYLLSIYRHPIFANKICMDEARDDLLKEIKDFKNGKKKYPYGWKDLLTYKLPFIRDSKKARICSELYVERTRKWISYQNMLNDRIISPYGLTLEPKFKRVWSL